jgi:muramidase (phage lysozyme)
MADTLNGNVQAFLWVIRNCEGTADPDGYRRHFGGDLFTSFADHPRVKKTYKLKKGGTLTSTAAGAYQILERTWDGLRRNHPGKFPDFEPSTQDLAAVELIRGRKALQDLEAGRFDDAIRKCALEWASLPGSPYGQPTKTLEFCKQIYEQHGGVYTMVAPIVVAAGAAAAKPFIEAAFTELLKNLPSLGKLFGSGSEVSNRNIAAMEVAVNVVKEAVGAKNEQEAVEIVKTDPAQAKAADDAVRANAYEIAGVDMSGVGEARKHDQIRAAEPIPFWKSSPAFWITVLLMPLLYYTVRTILTGSVAEGFSGEFKASVGSAVISGILGGTVGFWLGASFTTSRSRGLGATPTNG